MAKNKGKLVCDFLDSESDILSELPRHRWEDNIKLDLGEIMWWSIAHVLSR
jgi:hypothetical protein